MMLSACLPPPAPRVLKIGLVAPFEGHARDLGYDAVYAARLAAREINAGGGIGGWRVALVAFDDRAEVEMARIAARNLAIDAEVVAVIGHYIPATTEAAGPIYAEAGLPLVALGGVAEESFTSPEAEGCFVTPYPFPRDVPGLEAWRADYVAVGPHVPEPGRAALPTYEAVYVIAEAVADALAATRGAPSRASVAAALPAIRRAGALDFWAEAAPFTYCWEAGQPVLQEVLP